MDRRSFLKSSALGSVGGLLLPTSMLYGCRKELLFEKLDYDGKVVIIGAGAAGLYAAYLLRSKGVDVQVLEAAGRHGGRMGKLTGFADFPIDLGAEWMHGRNSIIGELAQNTNTATSLDDSPNTYWFDGSLRGTLPRNIEIFEGGDRPDISFLEYAQHQGFGEEYRFIVESLAGDQGASASKLSVKYNNIEEENWSSGEEDYRFAETYFDLLDRHIASKVLDRVRLNTVVSSIDHSGAQITIRDQDGNSYPADKVIITVPITVLKENDIVFTPPLPSSKSEAFARIGMEAGMKVFLRFSTRFYQQFVLGGSVCAAYADNSIGKAVPDNVLLAFVMGEQAEQLTALGADEAIIAALLAELDTMYNGQASASFMTAHVQNWTTEPFIRGAYSYSTVGIGNARSIAAEAVNGKLFFAGEAMNLNGHHQTVHGAVESAYREVIKLFESVAR